jgi:1-acyl-sn-glycerol-3-phosphate acyltransferase
LSTESRSLGLGGKPLGSDSLLLGGQGEGVRHAPDPEPQPEPGFDPAADDLSPPAASGSELAPTGQAPTPEQLRALLPATEVDRDLDDWGRSERLVSALDPLLNFYYRYWFRVDAEGVANVPSEGGALLVGNHSGALPPDAPMIMQAIRNEHRASRPLHILGEHWFKGFPAVSAFMNKIGVVPAHPANAQRLLADEGGLALVFPEGMKGTRKVLWQRYRLRRFGRGGFVRTALRARVPIVPIALVGGEEAMPIFAHMRLVQRMTGLLYAPFNHAFPHFGPLAALMYMPAKFRIRFLDPIDIPSMPADTIDDAAAVQTIAEEIRARIQISLDEMLAERRSVWLG